MDQKQKFCEDIVKINERIAVSSYNATILEILDALSYVMNFQST